MSTINVLLIDRSEHILKLLSRRLSVHPDIRIIGTANDPYQARKIIEHKKVDIIVMETKLPRMNGLTFIKYLMKYNPISVIILSSKVYKNAVITKKAIDLGVVDIIPKQCGFFSIKKTIMKLIKQIEIIKNDNFNSIRMFLEKKNNNAFIIQQLLYKKKIDLMNKIIVIGTSTGGTTALETLFKEFDNNFPATLVVIHMPKEFTRSFANRLNMSSSITIKEAENGEKVVPATVYLAAGGYHMTIEIVKNCKYIKLTDGPKVFNQRPAVDILFNSVAQICQKDTIGILLTGMGKDGAEGLLSIKNNGGYTIAEDEKSCVIFGMPKEAMELGAVTALLPLSKITQHVKSLLKIQKSS